MQQNHSNCLPSGFGIAHLNGSTAREQLLGAVRAEKPKSAHPISMSLSCFRREPEDSDLSVCPSMRHIDTSRHVPVPCPRDPVTSSRPGGNGPPQRPKTRPCPAQAEWHARAAVSWTSEAVDVLVGPNPSEAVAVTCLAACVCGKPVSDRQRCLEAQIP